MQGRRNGFQSEEEGGGEEGKEGGGELGGMELSLDALEWLKQ